MVWSSKNLFFHIAFLIALMVVVRVVADDWGQENDAGSSDSEFSGFPSGEEEEQEDAEALAFWNQDPGRPPHGVKAPRSEDEYSQIRQEAKNGALVMFYAPWCGHCQNAKPEFIDASTQLLRAGVTIPIVAVNCHASATRRICELRDIKAYPTVRFFSGPNDFDGTVFPKLQSAEIVTFMREKFDESVLLEDPASINFKTLRLSQLKTFLKARGDDWECVGCTEKGDFVRKAEQARFIPAKSKEQLRREYDLRYGTRTVLEDWHQRQAAKEAAEARWRTNSNNEPLQYAEGEEVNEGILHLWADKVVDIGGFAPPRAVSFVLFHAPGCEACVKAKPEWAAAALEIAQGETGAKLPCTVQLAALDCSHSQALCRSLEITHFPTVKTFRSDTAPESIDVQNNTFVNTGFTRSRILRAVVQAVNPSAVEPLPPFVNSALWEPNGNVQHVDDQYFDQVKGTARYTLAMFYAPWCGHCQAFKPTFAQASLFPDFQESVVFAAVDCAGAGAETCARYQVSAYPTIILLHGSDGSTPMRGGRSLEEVRSFLAAHVDAPITDEL
eukprot:gnl/Spiro4/1394_TR742_c0_g1_i1.p1 gnl/Spiro4/1394_TR742_c0_g1~~gnl/Spiro4/1394_TR742_c0_g1_i1.p1  ORF type:complete len:556 (+),score=108.12 gnl/Spiro4/1394_TR742_c0_g1_i1:114-1781(+)